MPPALPEILDSEDEDEISPIKSQDRVATLSSRGGASAEMDMEVDAFVFDCSGQAQGTGSTEKQLRQAHLDLMAPTQDGLNGDVSGNVVSPSVTRNKRRLSVSDTSPASLSGRAKRTKTDPTPSSQTQTGSTVSGATVPDPAVNCTSDTIAGATIPDALILEGQTPAKATRKQTATQRTPSDSSLTPWSVSAINTSGQKPSEPVSSGSRKRSQPVNHDNLNSDDVAIGLPVEQYKPRPSRSRSTQIVEESINYAVRPERAAKAKRSRTVDSPPTTDALLQPQETATPLFPERPILEAPQFEALSPPPAPADEYDFVLDPMTSAPAVAPVPKAKKGTKKAAKPKAAGKRGRPKKQVETIIEEGDALEDELALNPASKMQHMLNIQPAGEGSPQKEVQVVVTPRALSQNGTVGDEISQPDNSVAETRNIHDIVARLRQFSPQKEGLVGHEEAPLSTEKNESATRAEAVNTSNATPPSKATSVEKKMAGKEAVGRPQTPFSKYRVGLSKTQRIPSLLRVFKR